MNPANKNIHTNKGIGQSHIGGTGYSDSDFAIGKRNHYTKALALKYFSDVEKAFNRVQWDFLKEVMERMGFKDVFIFWIICIYSWQEAKIILYGFKSKWFSL